MFWGLSFGCPTGLTGQTCPTKKTLDFSKKGTKKHTGIFAGVQNLNLIMAKKGVKKAHKFFQQCTFFSCD